MTQSGVDSLLDALKKSGMDVDKEFFSRGNDEEGSSSSASSASSASTSGSASEESGTTFKYSKGGKSKGGATDKGAAGSGRGRGRGGNAGSAAGGLGSILGSMFGGAVGGNGGGDGGDDNGGSGDGNPPSNVEINFFDKMKEWGRGAKVVFGIVCVLVIAAAYWWFHPPINVHSLDFWFCILIVAVIVFLYLQSRGLMLSFKGKRQERNGEKGEGSANRSSARALRWLSLVPIVAFVAFALGILLSQSFFPGNAAKLSSILPLQNEDLTEDIQQVNYSQIPVIDRDTAAVLGNKEMGAISDYVSQFEISDLYSQINYKGKPVRVSPLGYADLFKWLTNRDEGIPAYVTVNMTTQDAQVIRISDVDGTTGQGIKYSESEPLARNIDRYVQLCYPFYMFDEKSFEIDEDGHPWWICPVQQYTVGLFGGVTISRVVLVDAVTGECQDLAIEDVPQWVDRAYPSSLLIRQYNWYGAYNNGWINSWLGQQGVVKTTEGTDGNLGYNYIAKDDDVWVYSGVTSATSDSSIIGFVLANQRTGEAHFYSVSGATEDSAMRSAEGQVQNLRYTATFPILINVGGQPTYFIALKDAEGLVKKFAMIDIQRYQNVAVGDTVAETQETYLRLLTQNGIEVHTDEPIIDTTKVEGVIDRIATGVVNGNSHYYVTLTGDKTIYDFALPNLLEIILYQSGDAIAFDVEVSEDENAEVKTVAAILEATAAEKADAKSDAADAKADPKADAADAKADAKADAADAKTDGSADAKAAGNQTA